jgi:hypothetical protein
MIEDTLCNSSESRLTAVESLKTLLDYAIAEGSELRLPVFVLLLRMASLELARSGRQEPHRSPGSPPTRRAAEGVEGVAP